MAQDTSIMSPRNASVVYDASAAYDPRDVSTARPPSAISMPMRTISWFSIRDAVNACPPGGILSIPEGEYDEFVVIRSPITLAPVLGARVVLRNSANSVLTIACKNVSIYGISIAQAPGHDVILPEGVPSALQVCVYVCVGNVNTSHGSILSFNKLPRHSTANK